MKRYIKANTEKPTIDDVTVEWSEFEDGSGIEFTISNEDEVIYEAVFDYSDVDPDAIYDSAVEMAIIALSQQYNLTEKAIAAIKSTT